MRSDKIKMLQADIPTLKSYRIDHKGLPQGVWFLVEIRPLPPLEQIPMIIADISNSVDVHISCTGSLSHSNQCTENEHILDKQLQKAIGKIKDQVFKVAIWEGLPVVYGHMPFFISLEPEITYNLYPDHPHICSGLDCNDFFIPESMCYNDKPENLGEDGYFRIINAFQEVSIWLFRHQVWLATRELGKGIWLGPDVKFKEHEQILYFRNPNHSCYCGSGSLYKKCHLQKNYEDFISFPMANQKVIKFLKETFELNGQFNTGRYEYWWKGSRNPMQKQAISQLRKLLV